MFKNKYGPYEMGCLSYSPNFATYGPSKKLKTRACMTGPIRQTIPIVSYLWVCACKEKGKMVLNAWSKVMKLLIFKITIHQTSNIE